MRSSGCGDHESIPCEDWLLDGSSSYLTGRDDPEKMADMQPASLCKQAGHCLATTRLPLYTRLVSQFELFSHRNGPLTSPTVCWDHKSHSPSQFLPIPPLPPPHAHRPTRPAYHRWRSRRPKPDKAPGQRWLLRPVRV